MEKEYDYGKNIIPIRLDLRHGTKEDTVKIVLEVDNIPEKKAADAITLWLEEMGDSLKERIEKAFPQKKDGEHEHQFFYAEIPQIYDGVIFKDCMKCNIRVVPERHEERYKKWLATLSQPLLDSIKDRVVMVVSNDKFYE